MLVNISAPIPNMISASDILLPFLPEGEPDLATVTELADDLMKKHGLYVATDYIFEVWSRRNKNRKDSDHGRQEA